MNILMLDIDGVLNHRDWWQRAPKPPDGASKVARYTTMIDPACASRLNLVLTSTGARIVVSSTWRYALKRAELQQVFQSVGINHAIYDYTPKLDFDEGTIVVSSPTRGQEILAWEQANSLLHPNIVVLDDDPDIAPYNDRWVRTSPHEGGLTYEVAAEIKRKFA